MHSRWSVAGLAKGCATRPWLTIALWGVGILFAGGAMLGVEDRLETNWDFTNTPESVQAKRLLESNILGKSSPAVEIIVVRSSQYTVDDPEFEEHSKKLAKSVTSLSGIVESIISYHGLPSFMRSAAEDLISKDRHTTFMVVTFAGDFFEMRKYVNDYLESLEVGRVDGFEIYGVGELTADKLSIETTIMDLVKGEMIAFPIAFIVLIFVFNSLIAASVPMILGMISIAVSMGVFAFSSYFFRVSFFGTNMITTIGLALGIDYSLFIVDRYREERARGHDKITAIVNASNTAGRATIFSGMTVFLAVFALFLLPSTYFFSFGVGGTSVALIAVFGTMTLLPAVLSLLGDRVGKPSRKSVNAAEISESELYSGGWGLVTRLTMRHPWISFLLSAGLLVFLFIFVFDMRTSLVGVESLPDSEVKSGYRILESDFAPGILSPLQMIVVGERNAATEEAIKALSNEIENDDIFSKKPKIKWNDSEDTALIEATLRASPTEDKAYEALDKLRNITLPNLFKNTNAQVFVTGATAYNYDFIEISKIRNLYLYISVLALSFILLLVTFRSLAIPIKAVIMNILSVGATYGLMVIVFQKGIGAELFGFQKVSNVEAGMPPFLFAVIFGLSMDYHVFMLSRMREIFHTKKDNMYAVAVGLRVTAKLITGAALIMMIVFGGFATGSTVLSQQLGFGLAVSVLLDATIVRAILVPASMALLGKNNWYFPRWLEWIPKISIEGEAEEASPRAEPSTAPVREAALAAPAAMPAPSAAAAPAGEPTSPLPARAREEISPAPSSATPLAPPTESPAPFLDALSVLRAMEQQKSDAVPPAPSPAPAAPDSPMDALASFKTAQPEPLPTPTGPAASEAGDSPAIPAAGEPPAPRPQPPAPKPFQPMDGRPRKAVLPWESATPRPQTRASTSPPGAGVISSSQSPSEKKIAAIPATVKPSPAQSGSSLSSQVPATSSSKSIPAVTRPSTSSSKSIPAVTRPATSSSKSIPAVTHPSKPAVPSVSLPRPPKPSAPRPTTAPAPARPAASTPGAAPAAQAANKLPTASRPALSKPLPREVSKPSSSPAASRVSAPQSGSSLSSQVPATSSSKSIPAVTRPSTSSSKSIPAVTRPATSSSKSIPAVTHPSKPAVPSVSLPRPPKPSAPRPTINPPTAKSATKDENK